MENQRRFEFEGELFRGPRGGYYIDFPYDASIIFGTKKQIRVKARINGHLMRKSLLPKGDGRHWLSVSIDVRQAIGKGDGDKVTMIVEQDSEPRIVDLPEDLEWLFDNEPDMKKLFMAQTYYSQNFFVSWISQTHDPDTRVIRINRIFEWLQQHKTGREAPSAEDGF